MANVKLIFYGTEESKTSEHQIECHLNFRNEIFIEVTSDDGDIQFICLDKSTAIKFAKTIRTEINKIEDE